MVRRISKVTKELKLIEEKCKDCKYFDMNFMVLMDEADGLCEHEANWRPSIGNKPVFSDNGKCKHFEGVNP